MVPTNSSYGVRYPQITDITNLGDARGNGFTVYFDRIGNYGSYVRRTYLQCLVGRKGEQLDYASPEDSRWRIIKTIDTSSGGTPPISIHVDQSDINTAILESGDKAKIYSDILLTKRAIHFAVFERVVCSYTGLTDLYFRIEAKKIRAYSLKNQAIADTYYNEGDEVWTHNINSTIQRVVVDLAERINGTTGKRHRRMAYVSSNSRIYGFDYYSGDLVSTTSDYGVGEINALCVDPLTGTLWFVLPEGSGKLSIVGIKPSTDGKFEQVNKFSIKPSKTKLDGLAIQPNGSKADDAKRITGGVVSRGAGNNIWFSFVTDKDSTMSVCVNAASSSTTVGAKLGDWYVLDRMHFGSWHGANATPSPEKFKLDSDATKAYNSYKSNKEYGIGKGTDNVQGICNGVGSAVYVNGHTYYHEDWRYWNKVVLKGWTTDGSRCGQYFTGNYYYPSYVIDKNTGEFLKDTSTSTAIANGWYQIEQKDARHEWGYPVDNFWMKFDKKKSGDVAHSYDKDHKVGDSTHCDFGFVGGTYNLPYNEASAKKMVGGSEFTAHWDGCPQIGYNTSTKWNRSPEEPAHLIAYEEEYNYAKGSHWYQLQDLGFIYGANASMMQPAAVSNTAITAHYVVSTNCNPQLYFSTGVCEDNPSQLTNSVTVNNPDGATLPNYLFDFNTERNPATGTAGSGRMSPDNTDKWEISGSYGNDVKGFKYQKQITGGTAASAYFSAMCPVYSDQDSRGKYSVYGWRGFFEMPTPYVWGFSEDWGINKAGYTIKNMKLPCEETPPPPKMSMFGMEERLNATGDLGNSKASAKHGHIIQTNAHNGVAYYIHQEEDPTAIELGRTHIVDGIISGLTSVYDVGIDDTNRLFFESNGATAATIKPYANTDDGRFKYANPYAENLRQFTALGNRKNTYQTIEACCLKYGGTYTYLAARAKTDTLAKCRALGTEIALINSLTISKSSFGSGGAWGTQFNNDPTGMDAIKTLGYCYTLRTQAHPLPVAPRGRLVITESRVRQERNCYETEIGKDFWQKSVIQPTTYNDIKGTLHSTDDFTQIVPSIIDPTTDRNDLYVHMGNATDKDAARAEKFGLSAAGYDHFATKHLLDVFTTGSYAPDEFVLEYRDAEERNRDANKHSTFKSFYAGADITSANNGFYVHYESPDAWDAITVYGKPIKTETTNGDTAKLYRWGQNTPYEKYTATDILRYSSIHPEVYVDTKADVERMTTQSWAWVENNDKDHTKSKSVQNPRYGYSDANNVSFSAISYDYPYGNPQIPGSDSITFYFGKNFVHVYERWSTPAMCATSDDPSGGLSLWGECEQ